MCYAHLTHKERYQIELLIQQGLSVSRIARMLHVHRSTIYREISRSGCKGNYRADHAQNSAERRIRRSADNHRCKPAGLWRLVRRYLRQDWSPEQIRGRLKYWRQVWVSVPAIYAHIRREREQGGHLYQHLRYAKRKRRWGAGHGGLTKDRPSIHQRPKRVKSRRQLGHWEGDTFIGTSHLYHTLTLVERTSRFVVLRHPPHSLWPYRTSHYPGLAKPTRAFHHL